MATIALLVQNCYIALLVETSLRQGEIHYTGGITSSLTLVPLSHGEHHVCWANPTMQMWWTGGYRMG